MTEHTDLSALLPKREPPTRVDTCPNCKHELRFDIHDRLQHCPNCGKAWSFHIDIDKGIVTVKQWASRFEGKITVKFDD